MCLEPILGFLPRDSHDGRKPYEPVNRQTHLLDGVASMAKRGETARVRGHEDHFHIWVFAVDVVDDGLEFWLTVTGADDCRGVRGSESICRGCG